MQKLAGRDWYYEFRELGQEFSGQSCSQVASKLLNRYTKLTKKWNADLNSEWTCRFFMAAKLVMAATLHVNALYFADSRNLRVVMPYLRYYSVLSLMRAVCYTHPDHDWKNGQLIQISHGKAINGVADQLRRFDKSYADSAVRLIREMKAERELISYRAPSSGDHLLADQNQFLSLCTLLAEVAQFNSELLEASLLKHADRNEFRLIPDYLNQIASVEIDGHYFGDCEDAYRLGYLVRKQPYPVNMQHFMKEGHVDDFFGAWASREDNDTFFSPDEMKSIIFDIP